MSGCRILDSPAVGRLALSSSHRQSPRKMIKKDRAVEQAWVESRWIYFTSGSSLNTEDTAVFCPKCNDHRIKIQIRAQGIFNLCMLRC